MKHVLVNLSFQIDVLCYITQHNVHFFVHFAINLPSLPALVAHLYVIPTCQRTLFSLIYVFGLEKKIELCK